MALYETDVEADLLRSAVADLRLERLEPATVRRHAVPGTWYLATQLMLHPIPLDPVPRIITDAGLPVAAVMYDVIPERYPDQYQARPTARAQVRLRGMLARTLDTLLAISAFAAETAAQELRFPRHRIEVIGAGVEQQFVPATADPWPRVRALLSDDGRRVVLMVSGTDSRKNTQRMLDAWGLVPEHIRAAHRLVVVGAVDDTLRLQWQQWARAAGAGSDVSFTGGVTDEEMVALHQLATLAVMPSTEEGFGLPVLEAAACGTPVIASSVSSLPEILAEPAAEFDPFDIRSIAAAVERALIDPEHRAVLQRAAGRAVERWTWAHTGAATIAALEAIGPRHTRTLRQPVRRIALEGRFDDSETGRANAALADDIAALPDAPEVHVLVDHATLATPTYAGPRRFPVRALGRFVHPSQFDRVIVLDAGSDRVALLESIASREAEAS
ncbi:MAG: glycosyltransferase family 1 protein [Ilumatobacteraceae bacterium]